MSGRRRGADAAKWTSAGVDSPTTKRSDLHLRCWLHSLHDDHKDHGWMARDVFKCPSGRMGSFGQSSAGQGGPETVPSGDSQSPDECPGRERYEICSEFLTTLANRHQFPADDARGGPPRVSRLLFSVPSASRCRGARRWFSFFRASNRPPVRNHASWDESNDSISPSRQKTLVQVRHPQQVHHPGTPGNG